MKMLRGVCLGLMLVFAAMWVDATFRDDLGSVPPRPPAAQEDGLTVRQHFPAIIAEKKDVVDLDFRLCNPKNHSVAGLRPTTVSCSCLEVHLGATELPAGGETTARMKMSVGTGRVGHQRLRAVVETNDPSLAWPLEATVTVYPKFILKPQSIGGELEAAGTCFHGQFDCLVHCRPDRLEQVSMASMRPSTAKLRIAVIRTTSWVNEDNIGCKQFTLAVTSAPLFREGTEQIDLTIADGDVPHKTLVPVRWSLASEYVAEPNALTFGGVDPSALPLTKGVSIRHRLNRSFSIVDVRKNSEDLELQTKQVGDAEWELSATIAAGDGSVAVVRENVLCKIKDAGGAISYLEVPCLAYRRKAP